MRIVAKKEVVVFTEIFPDAENPASGVFVLELVRNLIGHFDLTVIHPKRRGFLCGISKDNGSQGYGAENEEWKVINPVMFSPFRCDRLWLRSIMFVVAAFKFIFKNRGRNFVILAEMACPAGFAAVILGRLFNKQALIVAQGSDINVYPKLPILGAMVKYALLRADKIVTVSEDLRRKCAEITGRGKDIIAIRNGVDRARFMPMDKNACRTRLSLPLNRKIALFVGNILKSKGVFDLLRAAVLLKRDLDITIVFVGAGADMPELYKDVRMLELENEIVVVGNAAHRDVPVYMNACDVLCLPSYNEGMPNVILEALCCGTPVVATKVGGIPEIINDSRFGMLVEPKSPDRLSAALKEGLPKEWDRGFITDYSKQLSWEAAAGKYKDVIDKLSGKV